MILRVMIGFHRSLNQAIKLILDEVYNWAGFEIALAEISKNQLAVFQTKDVLKAAISLDNISRKINKVKGKAEVSLNHGEYTIKKLNHPELLAFLFGPIFSSVKENYYLPFVIISFLPIIRMFLIIVIDDFYNQKTLSQDLKLCFFLQ